MKRLDEIQQKYDACAPLIREFENAKHGGSFSGGVFPSVTAYRRLNRATADLPWLVDWARRAADCFERLSSFDAQVDGGVCWCREERGDCESIPCMMTRALLRELDGKDG